MAIDCEECSTKTYGKKMRWYHQRNNSSQMICQRYTCLAFDETGVSPYFSHSKFAASQLSCEWRVPRRKLMAARC